jgi:hypothetical protein
MSTHPFHDLAAIVANNPEWVTIFATGLIAGVRRWRVRPHQVEIRAEAVHIHVEDDVIVLRADQYEKSEAAA